MMHSDPSSSVGDEATMRGRGGGNRWQRKQRRTQRRGDGYDNGHRSTSSSASTRRSSRGPTFEAPSSSSDLVDSLSMKPKYPPPYYSPNFIIPTSGLGDIDDNDPGSDDEAEDNCDDSDDLDEEELPGAHRVRGPRYSGDDVTAGTGYDDVTTTNSPAADGDDPRTTIDSSTTGTTPTGVAANNPSSGVVDNLISAVLVEDDDNSNNNRNSGGTVRGDHERNQHPLATASPYKGYWTKRKIIIALAMFMLVAIITGTVVAAVTTRGDDGDGSIGSNGTKNINSTINNNNNRKPPSLAPSMSFSPTLQPTKYERTWIQVGEFFVLLGFFLLAYQGKRFTFSKKSIYCFRMPPFLLLSIRTQIIQMCIRHSIKIQLN